MSNTRDLSILDKHIIGRVTPHIYAFSTGTVPSYLKVGLARLLLQQLENVEISGRTR